MEQFESIRESLGRRSRVLRGRIRNIEQEMEREPAGPGPGARALEELLDSSRHELGLLESSLRRISRREYDCCMSCGATIPVTALDLFPYSVNCPACSRGFPLDYVQKLRMQHTELNRSLGVLLELLAGLLASYRAGTPDRGAELAARVLLGDLGRELPAHFELEERDGYMAEALAAAPRYQRLAGRLERQHASLARGIARIVDGAEAAGGSSDRWEELALDFRRFADALRAHEHAERDIMRDAFTDDLGGGD